MKRYLDLVPISAKVHKKQNRMSLFCIALAVFLVTTIFGMADMFIRSQIIKTRAETEVVLCGSNDRLFSKIFPNMLSEGTFPKTDNEAMATESARDMLALHIGDEITINTPVGLKQIFTLSGFVENTANLMSSDTYGVFLTTEKLYDIYSTNESDGLTDYPTVYYVQFASTLNVQSEIENLKSQCGLSGDQVSENTKLLGLLGQSTSSLPLFSTSFPSIIAGVAVGLLTVLMAARTPAKRAAKVSPLSAVSGSANDTQPVRKAANTNLFKVDAALGIHHAKSSRKNFILMGGSLDTVQNKTEYWTDCV